MQEEHLNSLLLRECVDSALLRDHSSSVPTPFRLVETPMVAPRELLRVMAMSEEATVSREDGELKVDELADTYFFLIFLFRYCAL